jgi:EAL domain-containing protein (putative c-di-GMP-specific phosphodiesterase class I)
MDDVSPVDPNRHATESETVHDGDGLRPGAGVWPADLAGQLRHAFSAGELTAYFQPQYDLKSGRVVAVEALCRWLHPVHGVLLPARFIDVAERYGMIADLGRYMLEESGRHVADWHRRGVAVSVSINVSPSELRPEFAAVVLGRLRDLELPEGSITVEITESPAIQYSAEEFATLNALIDGGVGVSIDDFGTGNTSLELVRRLPLTEVKIDKSLVHDDSAPTDALVRECLEIAHERGAVIVAEGIETQQHFDRAIEWGCDRAQGFYFSPPLPVAEIEPLLEGAA